MNDLGHDSGKELMQKQKKAHVLCGSLLVYRGEMGLAVVSTSIQNINISFQTTPVCVFSQVIKFCCVTFWYDVLQLYAMLSKESLIWEMFLLVVTSLQWELSGLIFPACWCVCLCLCLPVRLCCGRLRPVLVIGALVSSRPESLVWRLCPHITTADCSSGWLGFSAKTGITDPCRLPTFTAAFLMFTQSELRHLRELKRCLCLLVCMCVFQFPRV